MAVVTSGQITIADLNDAVVSVLSQESHVISTETDGGSGDFSAANTTLAIYLGAADDTANWTVAVTPSAGVVGSLSGTTFSVTDMTSDAGHVDFTATKVGFPDLSNRFSLSKSKRGVAGPALSIVASGNAFTFIDGVATPASQTIALTLVRQNATGSARWYASTDVPMETDLNQFSAASFMLGTPSGGTGDTCYVDLSTLGGADQLYVTAVVGNQTAVHCISSAHRSTAEAAANRIVFRGNRAISGTTWSDSEALAAVIATGATGVLKGDIVTLSKPSASYSETRIYTGSTWSPLSAYFGGDILVNGTVKADHLDVNSMAVAGLAVFNDTLQSSNYSPGAAGWKMDNAGNAEMNSLVVRTGNLESEASTLLRYTYDSVPITVASSSWVTVAKLVVPRTGKPTLFNIVINFDAYGNAGLTIGLFRENVQFSASGATSLGGRMSQAILACVDIDEGTGNTNYWLKAKLTDPSAIGGWNASVRTLSSAIEAKQFKR